MVGELGAWPKGAPIPAHVPARLALALLAVSALLLTSLQTPRGLGPQPRATQVATATVDQAARAAATLEASGRCYLLEKACLHAGGVVLQAHPPGEPLPVLDPG